MRGSQSGPVQGGSVEVRVPKRRKIETLEVSYSPSGASDPDFAQSSTPGWVPPARITSEQDALRLLKREWRNHATTSSLDAMGQDRRPVLIADLHNFELYRTPDGRRAGRDFELMSLLHWDAPIAYNSAVKLSFDGFLCIGTIKVYVQGLSVEFCSIEGYGQDEQPETVTYVQSSCAGSDPAYDIWFRIGQPSRRYKRFHQPFICIAHLTKHILDYLEEQASATLGLHSFRKDFHSWLISRYAYNAAFQRWHAEVNFRADFRVDVNAYRDFIYREAHNHPNSSALLAHSVWGECMAGGLTSVEVQPLVSKHTITTPYVYDNFKNMYFGKQLRAIPIADNVQKAQQRRKKELGFAQDGPKMSQSKPKYQPYNTAQVQVGDVVAFDPDEVDTRNWKKSEEQEWLAYVQDTQSLQDGVQRLFVIYLYRPSDTHIATATYSVESEVFLSDNCNCHEGQLLSTHVKGKYKFDWSPRTINTSRGYFARQTYMTNDSAFVTLREDHKMCRCRSRSQSKCPAYRAGDTVYVTRRNEKEEVLEPVVIHRINKDPTYATVRTLLRLRRDCGKLASQAGRSGDLSPNELVLTNEYTGVSMSMIKRHCNIRFVQKLDSQHGRIPFGYDRGGAGDLWFISMGLANVNGKASLMYLSRLNKPFHQGPELTAPAHLDTMAGLSMFSGGGNLDRGLEEGGAVEFRYAIDMEGPAVHTQRANAKDASKLRLFYGSVDDYMQLLLSGKKHELVAQIGSVHFIAAGSPCPGFSTLQQDVFSQSSIEHASHITTLCSAVEMYRPNYAILENVVSMAYTRKGLEDQNVLSQLIACLVSMGYQVSQYIMDSYNYGSAQHRSRVFVSMAAPGLEPIKQPLHTHSRPWEEVVGKSLGRLPNGESFGQREWYVTPFRHVSAGTIIGDLPDVGNGNVQTCVSHPDHRLSAPSNHSERSLLACIPSEPAGCGYREAYSRGLIPQQLQKPGREHGSGYKRIDKSKLIPTITTTINCRDAHNGACVHYHQHRALTILEARRAQGYLDEEPVIGNRVEQYRIVGNAVDRKVSFALGLSLRESVIVDIRKELVTKTEQETIMEIEEDEEHLSDVDSDASGIVVDIPQLDGGDERPRNVSRSKDKQKPCKKLAADDAKIANSSSRPQLTKVLSEGGPGIMAAQSQIPSLAAVTRRLKSVTINSRRPSLSPAANPISKRSYDNSDAEDHRPRKLHVSNAHGRGSPLGGRPSRMKTDIDVSRAGELSAKKRYTRHTGLEVEFVPKQWDKRPELLHSKTAQ